MGPVLARRGMGVAVALDRELGGHPGLGVAGEGAVEPVGSALEGAEIEGRGLAGAQVRRHHVRVAPGQVVYARAMVADDDFAAGCEPIGRQVDRELGSVRLDARAVGSCARGGDAVPALVDRTRAEARADDARQQGEAGEGEDGERPGVAADLAALHLALEFREPRSVVDGRGVAHRTDCRIGWAGFGRVVRHDAEDFGPEPGAGWGAKRRPAGRPSVAGLGISPRIRRGGGRPPDRRAPGGRGRGSPGHRGPLRLRRQRDRAPRSSGRARRRGRRC